MRFPAHPFLKFGLLRRLKSTILFRYHLCGGSLLQEYLTNPVPAPSQNGNYPNPPAIKRQFRDPNADWWDKQERRNFGEPVHEDNDILGVFSPEPYTHVTPGKAFLSIGTFVATFLGLCGVVSLLYPDKPSAPRTFPDGLEKELGGPNAVRARKPGEESW
ncbi:hypothetical protein T310_7938 [Rasamsonia emersonii CBS 393.64]|uniref:NADH:ubiquinone oxidoreductase kD subunit n=1 Tax=Rasamsonia emersonii (strain ATCC 16479 / CBS 393.64 / IMI 116815) TaxID=1408163 RepID=A0A0F4YIQ7_RASE3|nr:hypothetical protein T310_7938 [Rasamsonia emersonii CBS 393.64]KKA18114.1 hypothetical protein T310_7938 [Rasamsonia emersonii CBS 393.64]